MMSENNFDNKKDLMRESLRKQREKQLKKEQVKKIGFIVLTVIVLFSIVGSIIWFTQKSSDSEVSGEQLTPSKVDANGAFHVGAGGAVLDDNQPTGSTRVDNFFDPMCPGCGIVERGIGDRLVELLNEEEIDLYMTPVAFLDNASTDQYSTRAVNATITVAEESPEHYLAFVNNLYKEGNQPSEGQSYVSVPDSILSERAIEVGVPQEVADKFKEGHYTEWIKTNTQKQLNDRNDLFPDGFSTPAVFLELEYKNKETHEGEVVDFTRVEFDTAEIQEIFDTNLKNVKNNK